MTSPIDEAMRDFAVDQLEKEARGEHTYLDDIPDDQFMADEIASDIKIGYKMDNPILFRMALSKVKVLQKLLEKKT